MDQIRHKLDLGQARIIFIKLSTKAFQLNKNNTTIFCANQMTIPPSSCFAFESITMHETKVVGFYFVD
jgi:hypothetical protein